MSESGRGDFGSEIGFFDQGETRVCGDADDVAAAAARLVVDCAAKAIAARGRFLIALSGGSTPRALYELLARDEWRGRIDWPHVHVLWGDERMVPPDHDDSNYRMAYETLLAHVPVAPAHLYRMRGELPPMEAADDYERRLRTFFAGSETPAIDLVLLGLGGDGHTASLFPGRPAGREVTRWVVADEDATGRARLTLTPPVINAARAVAFIVTGGDKATAVRDVMEGPPQPDRLPAQRVRPRSGRLVWLLDVAAAAALNPSADSGPPAAR